MSVNFRELPKGNWILISNTSNYFVSEEGIIVGPTRKPLKPWNQKRGGYPAVKLRTIDGKSITKCVHSIMAETFLGPKPSDKHEVCHKDGNVLNCSVGNLYWGTRKQNVADMLRHVTQVKERPDIRGSLHHQAKLSELQVDEIRNTYIRGVNQHNKGNGTELAEKFGVTTGTISGIANHRGTIWRYYD